jgi:hypothetical protein
MQEICQSGSEGGAKRTFVPTPILAQDFNHISANLMRGPLMGEWLLSRRDSLIVARHEVPGYRCREPRPGGTVEVMVRDIRRRNGIDAALETLGIPVERYVGV